MGNFDEVLVCTHGEERGTAIETGSNFGSLIRRGGRVDMLSCLVGAPVALLGVPKTVENFCVGALADSQIRVSKEIVFFSLGGRSQEDSSVAQLFWTTTADWECYKCLADQETSSRKISCDGFSPVTIQP